MVPRSLCREAGDDYGAKADNAQRQKRQPGADLDHTASTREAGRQTSLGLAAGSKKSEKDADHCNSTIVSFSGNPLP